MTDTITSAGAVPPSAPNSYNPTTLAGIDPGVPVCSHATLAGIVIPADAAAVATAYAVGITSSAGAAGHPVHVQYDGPLTLTTAEWDARVTGQSGGLTTNGTYSLDGETAGKLKLGAPGAPGTFLGVAISPITLMVQIVPEFVPAAGVGTGAMFFGTTTGTGSAGNDYAATVAAGTAVPFPRNGPTSNAGITRNGASTSSVIVAETGIYQVSWQVGITEASQLELATVTAGPTYAPIANTCATSGAGTQQNTNTVLVSLTAGQAIAVINPAGNATALTVTPSDGSLTHAQAPNITITQVG